MLSALLPGLPKTSWAGYFIVLACPWCDLIPYLGRHNGFDLRVYRNRDRFPEVTQGEAHALMWPLTGLAMSPK